MPSHLTGRITYDPPLPRERNQVPQRTPMGGVVKILAFYASPFWRTEGGISEQVTFALNPHVYHPDHPLYIDSVFDVSPPGGPGVLASFLWNDDAFELLNKGPEVVQKTILKTWAGFLGSPGVATDSINFIVVDWPSQRRLHRLQAAGRMDLPARRLHQALRPHPLGGLRDLVPLARLL